MAIKQNTSLNGEDNGGTTMTSRLSPASLMNLVSIILVKIEGFADCVKINIWEKRKPAIKTSGLKNSSMTMNNS